MKVKLLGLFFLINAVANGQDIFPANDTSLISGKQLKVKPLDKMFQTYGYDCFYKDEKLKKKFDCCDGVNSKYNSLVDKIFKVVSITPYKDIIQKDKFKIKLNNTETGDIYFDYDPRYEHQWHFQFVGDFTIPKDFYCRNIEIIADKFTGDTTYMTQAASGFSFIKVKKGKSSTIYLKKNEPGSTLNLSKKGVILLLENNKRLEKPDADLDVKASSYGSGYVYTAFFELTENDIKLLTENAITDSRLYIYDGKVRDGDGKRIIEFLKCIVDK
jgi:predicted secreted protein